MISDVPQHAQRLQVDAIAFCNPPSLWIELQIFTPEYLPFARNRELAIEGGPIDLVPQFEGGEGDPETLQLAEQRFEHGAEPRRIGAGERVGGPHIWHVLDGRAPLRSFAILQPDDQIGLDAALIGPADEIDCRL